MSYKSLAPVGCSSSLKSSKGFVLFSVLIVLLFAGILFGYMQENLRLASFVELHAKQKISTQKACELALEKIIKKNIAECQKCQIKNNNMTFEYNLTKIILENQDAQEEKYLAKIKLSCIDGQTDVGAIEAVIDPVDKTLLSFKWQ